MENLSCQRLDNLNYFGSFFAHIGLPSPTKLYNFAKNFQTAFDPNPLMGFMVSNKRCSSKYMSQYLENSFKPAPPSLIAIDTSLNSHSLWLPHSLFKENQMVLIRHRYLAHCIAIGFLVPRAFQKYITCMVCADFLISSRNSQMGEGGRGANTYFKTLPKPQRAR